VTYFEQPPTGLTTVNDLIEGITDATPRETLKPSVKLHTFGRLKWEGSLKKKFDF
jgi:hypothetical protein